MTIVESVGLHRLSAELMSDLIQYSIRPSSPEAHLYSISLTIPQPDSGGQRMSLPAWIPGSYMIRDFARNIVSIHASCERQSVALTKLDKQTWQASAVNGALVVEYQVYAWDLSVRSAHLDTTHGFFNGSSVFLRVVGQEDRPQRVIIERPQGKAYQQWKLATSMPQRTVDEQAFGTYEAADYQCLVDYPVEMGDFQEFGFAVQGVPHRMVLTGRCVVDKQRMAQDLEKICAHHAEFFAELPVKQYLFLTMVVGDGYGGLEHLDSTSLLCQRDDMPLPGKPEMSKGYRRFLGLCSHEYFHLWNVKRIRPQILQQADLSQEVHTELLWAFEGITSYFDDLALVRSGCIEASDYLGLMAQTVSRVMRGSGRRKQSVAESSFDAWTRFYKQDENAPNSIVSYYAKGTLVALGLDIQLRESSNDSQSLDHMMRELWQRYGKTDTGVAEDGIEKLAAEIAGCELADFFQAYVHGTSELPLADWFSALGIGFRLRPATDQGDWGGYCEQPGETEGKPTIGARYQQRGDFVQLTHVLDGGAAQSAGLSAGDRLLAMDGLQVNADNLEQLLVMAEEGAPILVYAFRRDELMSFQLRPLLAPADTCDLWFYPDEDCNEQQLTRRSQWLASS